MGANFLFSSFPAHYDSEKTNKLIISGVPVYAVNRNNVILVVSQSIYHAHTSHPAYPHYHTWGFSTLISHNIT